jgi:hypothetical protein
MSGRAVAALTLGLMGLGASACPSKPAPAPDAGRTAQAPTPPPPSVRTATAADPGQPLPESARLAEQTLARLEAWVRPGASDPTNAWALAHGLTGFGAEHTASDGRRAIEVLSHDFIRTEGEGATKRYHFPEKAADGQPVEPHTDLIVKSMLEAGVPLVARLPLRDGGGVSLDALLGELLGRLRLPADDAGWHDFAWTLGAAIGADRATTPSGPALAEAALAYVEGQQSFLVPAMRARRPELVEKRKQLIYSHTCGGLHVMQAALQAVARHGDAAAKARALEQLEILFFRWQAERVIYMRTRRENPQYAILLRTQELKFHGHVLETLALAHRWGLLPATGENRTRAGLVLRDLAATVEALEEAYADLPKVRKSREQTYLDLIGDGCHAIRGLRGALVAFFRA